jgi:hypothetical protein
MDRFAFEGGQISARQLARQVTAYSEGALQTALESGCQSVPDVMTFLAQRDYRLQAQRKQHGMNNNARRVRV